MNKKIESKIKRIADKKAKLEVLKKEIENLEIEVQSAKDKEFNTLSKAFFAADTPAQKDQLEAKIKVLLGLGGH